MAERTWGAPDDPSRWEAQFSDLPNMASPRDQMVGINELGQRVYKSPTGTQYWFTPPEEVYERPSVIKELMRSASSQPITKSASAVVKALAGGAWDAISGPGRAAAGEPVTYGDVANTAGIISLGAAPMSIPQDALGMSALRRFPVDEASQYIRRSQMPNTPDNGAGYSMFAKSKDPRSTFEDLDTYGNYGWIANGEDGVDIRDIQADIVRSLRSRGAHTGYQTTAAQLARSANPENIVDSAGLWDDMDLVSNIWEDVLEPQGISKVITNDGMLLFDPRLARRYTGDE